MGFRGTTNSWSRFSCWSCYGIRILWVCLDTALMEMRDSWFMNTCQREAWKITCLVSSLFLSRKHSRSNVISLLCFSFDWFLLPCPLLRYFVLGSDAVFILVCGLVVEDTSNSSKYRAICLIEFACSYVMTLIYVPSPWIFISVLLAAVDIKNWCRFV